MGDLEDFFAKRDKKKKGKPANDVKGLLDAKAKERKNKETHKSTYQPQPSEIPEPSDYKASEGDDEWKEIVDEKPDFSGLKIQELVLESSDDEAKEGEDGGSGADKESPWTKVKPVSGEEVRPLVDVIANGKPIHRLLAGKEGEKGMAPEQATEAVKKAILEEGPEGELPTDRLLKNPDLPASAREALEEAAEIDKEVQAGPAPAVPSLANPTIPAPTKLPGASGGTYIPPSKRFGASSSSSSSSSVPFGSALASRPRKATAAPNINDEQFFPSLGDAVKTSQKS